MINIRLEKSNCQHSIWIRLEKQGESCQSIGMSQLLDDTKRKHVLVTGGTQGIGLAIARGFAKAGWMVTAAGLGLKPEHQSTQGVSFVELDVTDPIAIEALLDQIDSLDALVNAAGVIARNDEFDIEIFEHVVNVNLTGAMRVSTAARDKLSVNGGAIINLASMLSYFGGAFVPAYSASKGGVVQLTKSLAIAWAEYGIRVNAIAPGWIETEMTEALRSDSERNAAILSRTPMQRWGKLEEMVGPVLFLASPAASFVTGAVLPVDGGYAIC